MKIKKGLKLFYLILGIGTASVIQTCGSREDTVNCFPQQQIRVVLNLNLPAYASGLDTNGWIYINEQQSGSRGLILVRTGTFPNYRFRVYDRNAPHICPDVNTTLEVQGNIKIVCPKDGAEWIMNDGTPVRGSNLPPKTYPNSYNPATGVITISY